MPSGCFACTPALALLVAGSAFAQVVTSQYDNARTGADTTETLLTPRNVDASQFGRRFRIPVDGDVFAQPLYLRHLALEGNRVRNALFVATEHGSVYACDADSLTQEPLWRTTFINPGAGITPLSNRDVHCPFIRPEVSITSTPVIDPKAGALYVLVRTREAIGGGEVRYLQRLHALDVHRGTERPGSPVEIRAAAPGSGDGSAGGNITFDPLRENPRASLLLTAGYVVLSWASSCDVGPYHGWVMYYDASTLAQVAAINATPDGDDGGIWQSDTGPAADDAGKVFVVTGNGRFDGASGGRDYGNSALALTLEGGKLRIADSFTPFDQATLDAQDGDLGSGGPVLAAEPGAKTRRMIFGGKAGKLYVLDAAHLGGFHQGSDAGAVQTLEDSEGEYGAPAYWNGHLFLQGSNAPLRDFHLVAGKLSIPAAAQSSARLPNPGATPTVSANGSRDGIVWLVQSKPFGSEDRPAILHAYDAADVARELYNSEQKPDRDRAGIGLRFNIPMVADGKVYVGTRGGVDVYGLLAPAERRRTSN